jgi:hypothetical protein
LFLPDHLDALVRTINSSDPADIAYSWRSLVQKDGTPYVEDRYIWTPSARFATTREDLARHVYGELVKGGVRDYGSELVRDCLIDNQGDKIFTIDMNELLVRASTQFRFPFRTHFSWREMTGDYSDDHAWVEDCYRAGLRFRCSEIYSVKYFVGGASNW